MWCVLCPSYSSTLNISRAITIDHHPSCVLTSYLSTAYESTFSLTLQNNYTGTYQTTCMDRTKQKYCFSTQRCVQQNHKQGGCFDPSGASPHKPRPFAGTVIRSHQHTTQLSSLQSFDHCSRQQTTTKGKNALI